MACDNRIMPRPMFPLRVNDIDFTDTDALRQGIESAMFMANCNGVLIDMLENIAVEYAAQKMTAQKMTEPYCQQMMAQMNSFGQEQQATQNPPSAFVPYQPSEKWGIGIPTNQDFPRADGAQEKWLRDLLTETQLERDEALAVRDSAINALKIAQAEILSLRERVATRDASVLHAIRTGRKINNG